MIGLGIVAAGNFFCIKNAVAIGIAVVWIGAEGEFLGVGEAVSIGISVRSVVGIAGAGVVGVEAVVFFPFVVEKVSVGVSQ